jgi:anti-sigma B factor antagonist
MPLVIQTETGSNALAAQTATLRLSGSLDTATAPELEAQLVTLLAGPIKELVFDLAGLSFISSAGLRVIAQARKQLRERGGLASESRFSKT